MITKIIDTVHTVGIDSFSMYENFTRPSDGFPKQTKRQDFVFNQSSISEHVMGNAIFAFGILTDKTKEERFLTHDSKSWVNI